MPMAQSRPSTHPTPAHTYEPSPTHPHAPQEACGCEVMGEVEGAFDDYLSDYPAPELRWLAALHDAKLKQRSTAGGAAAPAAVASGAGHSQQQQGPLSQELVLDFLAMNEEVGGGVVWCV